MKQWDIYIYGFDREGAPPVVIISTDERCQNSDLNYVNALMCTSAKLNREPKKMKSSSMKVTDWIGKRQLGAM